MFKIAPKSYVPDKPVTQKANGPDESQIAKIQKGNPIKKKKKHVRMFGGA